MYLPAGKCYSFKMRLPFLSLLLCFPLLLGSKILHSLHNRRRFTTFTIRLSLSFVQHFKWEIECNDLFDVKMKK